MLEALVQVSKISDPLLREEVTEKRMVWKDSQSLSNLVPRTQLLLKKIDEIGGKIEARLQVQKARKCLLRYFECQRAWRPY
jgi:hypothetical protein